MVSQESDVNMLQRAKAAAIQAGQIPVEWVVGTATLDELRVEAGDWAWPEPNDFIKHTLWGLPVQTYQQTPNAWWALRTESPTAVELVDTPAGPGLKRATQLKDADWWADQWKPTPPPHFVDDEEDPETPADLSQIAADLKALAAKHAPPHGEPKKFLDAAMTLVADDSAFLSALDHFAKAFAVPPTQIASPTPPTPDPAVLMAAAAAVRHAADKLAQEIELGQVPTTGASYYATAGQMVVRLTVQISKETPPWTP